MSENPPEGWYPDPADAARSRWWNGEQWTGTTRPRAQRARPAAPETREPSAPDRRGQPTPAAEPARRGHLLRSTSDDLLVAGSGLATAVEERDEVALLRDDDFSLTPQSEEAEARRRLEYERLQRLRASRVIRQDRIEELVVQRSSNVDARPWWRRAASVVGQTLVIVAVIVIWTTILGLLLSEDSSGDTRSGSVEADGEAPTDGDATEVLGTELERDEAGPDRGSAGTNASAAPGAVEAQPSRALGALPPIPIEFDGRCALEVDPDELTDLSSVWPWQFAECEYAPIDLDGVGAVWIVVVSSIDGVGTVPPNAPTIRGGEELGLLWSSHYPSLNEGWWVVYGGPYGSEADASRARSAIGGSSYIRRLSETDVER